MKVNLFGLTLVIYLTSSNGQYIPNLADSYNSDDSARNQGTDDPSSDMNPILVPIGYSKHYPVQYIDYKSDNKDRKSNILEVDASGGNIPLNIIFNPRFDHLRVADKNDHSFNNPNDQKYTYSEEKPVITYHEINTPLFEDMVQVFDGFFDSTHTNSEYNYDNNEEFSGPVNNPDNISYS